MPVRRPYRLARLYQGAGLGSLASEIGETSAMSSSLVGAQEAERRRGRLLAKAVSENKLDVNQLSAADSSLAGKYMGSVKKPSGGFLSGVGGFFENLGSDIWESAKGIPAGLVETGGALLSDFGSAIMPTLGGPTGVRKSDFGEPGSDVKKRVIDPTVESYKYMYGGVGAEPGSSFFERFYEHPLQPVIDVATVASLGAGGAARAGLTPALTRTTGRAPLVLGEGAEIPRQYSARPLRNIGQRATDRLENLVPPFGDFRTSRGVKRMQREESAQEMAGEASAVRHAVQPLIQTTKDLSYEEGIALDYALRGWNTPEQIQASRDMFQASLAGELRPGENIADFEGIFDSPEDARAYVGYKANLPEEVEQLILNPTPAMVEAARARRADVEGAFENAGLSPEEIAARHGRSQGILADFVGRREGGGEEPGPEGGPPLPPEGPPPPDIPPDIEPSPGPQGLDPNDPELTGYGDHIRTRHLDDEAPGGEGTWRDVAESMPRVAQDLNFTDEGRYRGMDVYGDYEAGDLTMSPDGNVNFVFQDEETGTIFGYGNIQYFNGKTQFFVAAENAQIERLMLDGMAMWDHEKGIPAAPERRLNFGDEGARLTPEQMQVAERMSVVHGPFRDFKAMIDEELRSGNEAQAWEYWDSVVQEVLYDTDVDPQMLGPIHEIATQVYDQNPNTWHSFVWHAGNESGWKGFDEATTEIPDIPDSPQSLFERWGMGDQIDVPEVPDTPGAFFAQYGEPETPQAPDTPLNGIEGKNLDEASGQDLRNMALVDNPEAFQEAQAEGFEAPTTGDMDAELVRRLEEGGHLSQGDPGLSEVPSWNQGDPEFGWKTFVLRDHEGRPVAVGEVGLTKADGQAVDYQEVMLVPDLDPEETLNVLAQGIVEHTRRGTMEPNLDSFFEQWENSGTSRMSAYDHPDAVDPADEAFLQGDTPEGAYHSGFDEYTGQPSTPESFWDEGGFGESPPPPPTNGPPEVTGGFGDQPSEYPIEPTWVPDQLARGFKEQRLGWLARMSTDNPESQFVRGKRDRRLTPGGVTASNMFEASGDAALREPGPEALMSGAVRMDPKSFVEHVARRERDIIAQAFDQHILQQVAAKGENEEPVRFARQQDVEKALGPDWVLVHDQFPIKWFVGETEFLRDTLNKLQEMQDMGIATTDENVLSQLESLASDHAQEFVRKSFGARKIDGVAVPRNFFEYQKRIVQATDPFDHPAGRALARYIHRWRTLTLAYMPRWAVNTAIGSFLLNMVKGVGFRREYGVAKRLKQEGRFAKPDLAGVELGNVIGLDYLEPGMHGVGGGIERQTGVKVTGFGERIVEKVQQIEDYFRRASFVHSLDRVGKQRMAEMGTVLSNLEKRRGVMADDQYIEQLMRDPQLIQAAIDDLNKFSYNFASLGPYERRYVRMAIPFWGWYKFISKFAYRLPVEYPGRSNILANVGMLGNMTQEEAGMFPEWMRGFIPLEESDKGELTYLSTLGVNPLGQFFNPFGKQGLVQGAVNVGQASPPIQAGLAALGVDTLRGGVVPISPQSGVGTDFFGSWIDTKSGTETSPLIEGAARRGIMGLIRAAPQVRMAEERLSGGRPVYPESIPFISERPMPIREGTRRDTSLLATMAQMTGVYPKHFDLQAYQRLLPERVKYARARNRTQMKRLRKSLRNP